jgi:hypothetical protein
LYRSKVRFFRRHRGQVAAAALAVLFSGVSRGRRVVRAALGLQPPGISLRARDLWREPGPS